MPTVGGAASCGQSLADQRRYDKEELMERRIIHTDDAPQAIGPYSQAVRTGEFIFCAGQIPLDPSSMKVIEGDIAAQTRRVLTNLSSVLEAAGSSLGRVVKTTVFLANLDDFKAMNQVYGEFFSSQPPARSTVQVARLPAGALVEIEAIAIVN
jgi:2-iminobutanoate/2-iminopropanoate deaminase